MPCISNGQRWCHPRESGGPSGQLHALMIALDSRLRGNDGDTAPYTHAISFGDALDELGRATLEKREPVRIVDLDLSFHDNICRLADHGRLYAAWHSVSTQARVLAGLTSKTHYNHPEEPKELHLVILEAMRAGDLARATEYPTNHILDAQERAVRALAMLRQDSAE